MTLIHSLSCLSLSLSLSLSHPVLKKNPKQKKWSEVARNPTPITFSDYPPNTCHSETYPSADTAPSKPENPTRFNPPPPAKYSPSPTSSPPPRIASATATSTTTPSSKSDAPSPGTAGSFEPSSLNWRGS